MPALLTMHNPYGETLLASAARTATANTATLFNHESLGVLLYLDVTAAAATPSVVPTVQFSPDGGTTWVNYAAFTAVTGIAATSYLLYPGILASADGALSESVNLPLPRCWRVSMVAADADSLTYSLVVQFL